jgi:hypothetical protein
MDYPYSWVVGEIRIWSEQYLLEAFLTSNADWKIVGGVYFLYHNYFDLLKEKCPRLIARKLMDTNFPASFYIVKK